MEGFVRDLFIALSSSLITLLIIYIFTQGIKITKKSRLKSKQDRKKEKGLWETGGLEIRQEITNEYLFGILKYLFLANMFLIISQVYPNISEYFNLIFEINYLIFLGSYFLAMVFFYLGFSKVIKYIRLRKKNSLGTVN